MLTVPTSRRHRLHRVWSEVWRVLAAALTGVVLLGFTLSEADSSGVIDQREGLYAFDALLGLVSLAVLPLRRRAPLVVAFGLACLGAVSISGVGATGIAIISLATQRRWRPLVLVAIPWMIASSVYDMVNPSEDTDPLLTLGFAVVLYLLCVVIGYYVGTRRELITRLRERAENAEQQQAMRLTQARIAERHRIAREMHDVLAHRISLIAMHSGALAYREDLTATQTQESASLIRDTSHQALQELRDVLGVLRAQAGSEVGSVDGTDAHVGVRPELPQPTLADLDTLVTETRRAGLDLRVRTDPGLDLVPVTLSRNAYRIIQEALTNARKHAAGSVVQVDLASRPDDRLTIRVSNGIPASRPGSAAPLPSSGLGLMGLTERAVLAGGDLRYGPDRRGDFVLEAWLPWTT